MAQSDKMSAQEFHSIASTVPVRIPYLDDPGFEDCKAIKEYALNPVVTKSGDNPFTETKAMALSIAMRAGFNHDIEWVRHVNELDLIVASQPYLLGETTLTTDHEQVTDALAKAKKIASDSVCQAIAQMAILNAVFNRLAPGDHFAWRRIGPVIRYRLTAKLALLEDCVWWVRYQAESHDASIYVQDAVYTKPVGYLAALAVEAADELIKPSLAHINLPSTIWLNYGGSSRFYTWLNAWFSVVVDPGRTVSGNASPWDQASMDQKQFFDTLAATGWNLRSNNGVFSSLRSHSPSPLLEHQPWTPVEAVSTLPFQEDTDVANWMAALDDDIWDDWYIY